MLKLGTYFSFAFIVWNLCVSHGKSWNGEPSRSILNDPGNLFMIKTLPLLDHIAKQCKSNSSDVLKETHALVVTIEGQLTGLKRDNEENLDAMKAQLLEYFRNIFKENFEERLAKIEEQQTSLHGSQIILERMDKYQKDMQNQMNTQQAALMQTLSGSSRNVVSSKFEQIGSRYFHISNIVTDDFNTAVQTCREVGGYLASIKNQEELEAITAKLDDKHYWLGINELVSEGTWVSEASGKIAPYLKWRPNEPNNNEGFEHCVELLNGGMNDIPCDSNVFQKYAICQADNKV